MSAHNHLHVPLPCSGKLISMLPEEVKADYVGEIMGQNVTNRLVDENEDECEL